MANRKQLLGLPGLSAHDVLHKDRGAKPKRDGFHWTDRQHQPRTTMEQRSLAPPEITGRSSRAAWAKGREEALARMPRINPYHQVGQTAKMFKAWSLGYDSATKKSVEPSHNKGQKKKRPAG